MERIAPLAKILAEANGIDWRNLHGSGEGGLIVEGDILSYLSRIMSGEEEPPATPVDAPPPEWTGTELPAGAGLLAPGMPSMDMLSSAGVDSDLAALVGRPAPAASVPATLEPATLEEEALEFELEEDEQVTPAPPASQPDLRPAAAPTFAAPSFPAAEVAAPLTPPAPEFVPPAPLLGRERPAAPVGHTPGLAAVSQPEPAAATLETPPPPPAVGGLRGGLGNLLSRLYQPPAAQPAPAPAAPPVEAAPFQAAPAPSLPETLAAEARPVPVPAPRAPEVEAPVAEAPMAEVPAPEPEETAPLVPEGAAAPAEQEFPEVRVAEQVAEPRLAPAESGAPAALPAPGDDRPREAVWLGAYLRRDANLAPATELRRQLTAALGQDVPLALLVARAAARHADSLGLSSVAVQDLDAGRARTVQSGSLRSALDALHTDHGGTPDLLVIDAGTLSLDDLHLGHTVTLSVGRLRDGHAALSLNGDVDAAQAARFLANVAGTLEEPIILVI